jgi:hypothetical protein
MTGRLPNFLGIGAQKCGTTTLHRLLEKHPQIFLPKCKEVHFFDLKFEKGIDWYKENFKRANTKSICGEITPYYLFHPDAPERIKSITPDAKLIILLRDPIDRAISQYYHSKERGFEWLDIASALYAEKERIQGNSKGSLQKHSYTSRSKYINQLIKYEERFKQEQILICKSEEFFNEMEETWNHIQDFLDLEHVEIPGEAIKANQGSQKREEISPSVFEYLQSELETTYEEMERRYGITWCSKMQERL